MSSSTQSLSRASETEPLLPPSHGDGAVDVSSRLEVLKDPVEGAALQRGDEDINGEAFDNVPREKRQIGLVSAVFLIFNKVIGTAIYATPSLILKSSGSVGMSFIMWILGALIAAAGTAVYIEFGTGLPRSGGEKNYLEFIYRRPKFLMTCAYAMFALFIGWASGSSIALGEYVVNALAMPITRTNTRIVAFIALTCAFLLHGTYLKWGLRVQNALGVCMLLVLLIIALSGLLSLAEFPGFQLEDARKAHNFDGGRIWEGTRLEANALVAALYSVTWAYLGYSNANYALSEVRDPVQTIKRAAPLAMLSVSIVYMLVNIAYLAVVPKDEILGGGRIVAAVFFRNLFGPITEKVFSIIIAFSTFGNVLANFFAHGRVIQELGREGILPYSSFFSSNKPFKAPFAGLFSQWVVCSIIAVAPPPGDAYNFILSVASYPISIINVLIAAGLLFLHTSAGKEWAWSPPFQAWTPVVVFFLLSNVFLVIVPLVPPAPGFSVYDHLPYWLHIVVVLGIALLGGVYWYVWCAWLPRRGGYVLVREYMLQEDGVSRSVFKKVPVR